MHSEKTGSVSLHRTLESVINRNGRRWFRFILGILKNEADAEDAMQEAVRRVLTRNRSFPSEEQVRMYLGRAIGNTAYEMYNSRKRERLRSSPIHDAIVSSDKAFITGTNAEEHSGQKNRMLGLLQDGLKQLPLKQEEALRMTILESGGASMRKVGLKNNIPYSTLRHRNKQGLRRMKQFLEKAVERVNV